MQLLSIEPRVQLVTDSFTDLPAMVAGTDRIVMLPRRLAERVPAELGLTVWRPPFDVVPLVEGASWQPSRNAMSSTDFCARFSPM
ncbi:hypothetical protein ACLBYD_27675 [Rhodococcus sp. C26F]